MVNKVHLKKDVRLFHMETHGRASNQLVPYGCCLSRQEQNIKHFVPVLRINVKSRSNPETHTKKKKIKAALL